MAELDAITVFGKAVDNLARLVEVVSGMQEDLDILRRRDRELEDGIAALSNRIEAVQRSVLDTSRRVDDVHTRALRALTDRYERDV